MKTIEASEDNLKEIITALKNGAVLVLPTDTVYGLVCDAKNKKAVEKIFEIKDRDKTKPLAVFVEDIEMAREFADIDRRAKKFLKNNKTTIIVRAKNNGLSSLVYKDGTIGLRVPKYKLISQILNEISGPLAQSSANISYQPPLLEIGQIIAVFTHRINQPDLIVDAGDLRKSKPSIIMDITKKKINILRK